MTTNPQTDRREQIRRAIAEADGFRFESLEPHDYRKHADAILALLAAVQPPAVDRGALRDRIAEAARTVPLRLGPNAIAIALRDESVILSGTEADAVADAVLAVLPTPAGRAAVLREAADELWALANRLTERGQGVLWAADRLRRMADEQPPTPPAVDQTDLFEQLRADRAVILSETDRAMLHYALNQAQLRLWRHGPATEEDQAALDRLRRMADEEQPEGAAPTETLDLTDSPVRCPLCPGPVTLHTPNGARAHFAHVHPEERLVGSGPWPLLANRADEEQQPETQAAALAPMFEGLERLIATSSRDWGQYRVDAWLWAVLVGWDCEQQHEHDETCDDGAAMRGLAALHGWDDGTVAKARRYRTAVRAVVEAQQSAEADTLPAWLYQRFINALDASAWDRLTDDDRAYWEHQARAVRRAVARGGFKQPAAVAQQDGAAT